VSTPALVCCLRMSTTGAPVNGSRPPPQFQKIRTSRSESVSATNMHPILSSLLRGASTRTRHGNLRREASPDLNSSPWCLQASVGASTETSPRSEPYNGPGSICQLSRYPTTSTTRHTPSRQAGHLARTDDRYVERSRVQSPDRRPVSANEPHFALLGACCGRRCAHP
jgi:hypothetical protein